MLTGSWRLESWAVGGEAVAAEGRIAYGEDGEMMVLITRPDRPPMGYAGTWHQEGDEVVHRVAFHTDPERIGQVQRRRVELVGDRLRLFFAGNRLGWRRIATA